nr:uncharacterized protein LOC129386353 [Dermacentor andersoni]
MNSEAATPDDSSEVENSGTSTVKVRRTRRLGSLFAHLRATERRQSRYRMSGMQDFSSYPGQHKGPPAPPSSPEAAKDGSKLEAAGEDGKRKSDRKFSRVKQRTASRIRKLEADVSLKETKLDSPPLLPPSQQRMSDLLSRSLVPSKLRSSTQTESYSLPFRKWYVML